MPASNQRPTYGFKADRQTDAVAIAAILSQATSVDETNYDTLAQYEIESVDLQPASLSFGLPQQWMLTAKTSLLGFNRPDGQSMYFSDVPGDHSGDGRLNFPLDVDLYNKMLSGGLYKNAPQYLQKLQETLSHKRFYRQTRVNLTTATVPTVRNEIAVGDLRAKPQEFRQYLIGSELTNSVDYAAENDQKRVINSDFVNLVSQMVDTLAKVPIETPYTLDLAEASNHPEINVNAIMDTPFDENSRQNNKPKSKALDTPLAPRPENDVPKFEIPTNDVSDVSNAFDSFAIDKPSINDTNKNESSTVSSDASSASQTNNQDNQSVDSVVDDSQTSQSKAVKRSVARSEQAQVSDPVNDVDEVTNLDDIMGQLNALQAKQNANRRKRQSHVYVDDFGNALQSSNQAKRQTAPKSASDVKPDSKKDNGADLGL